MASVGSPPDSGSGGANPQLLMAARNELNKRVIFLRLLAIRAFNAYWLLTFFQPDEFFQALEPAWQMAFGDGSGAWLTWEWRHQLRSSLHPALFAGAYWVAEQGTRFFPLGAYIRPFVLLAAPRLVQCVCAAAGDWYTWQLAVRVFGVDSSASWFALLMSMCNPFHWYCSTRTFSNSLETTLTSMALYYWPWELFSVNETVKENTKGSKRVLASPGSVNGLRLSLILAAVAVTLRPTNLLIWLTILLTTVITATLTPNTVASFSTMTILVREIIICGSLVLGASLVSDRLWFGEWTFPPYKWLYFNISHSLAVFYGRNDWHYYLSQGIPLLSTSYLPFVLVALYKTPTTGFRVADLTLRTLAATVFTMVAALSLISHKEVRFIYPLLPALHVLAAPYAADFFTTSPKKNAVASASATSKSGSPSVKPKLRNKGYMTAAVALNILLAGYLSLFHQPAPLKVLTFLREQFELVHPEQAQLLPPYPSNTSSSISALSAQKEELELFALFLTPCHSTPWRSHLVHPTLNARALTCEPPLHTKPDTLERNTYRDEADRFYDDPQRFLAREMWPVAVSGADADDENPLLPQLEKVPRYIVGFEGIEPWLEEFFGPSSSASASAAAAAAAGSQEHEGEVTTQLERVKLTRVWEGWNGLFNEDWRRAGKLVVWDTGVFTAES